MRTAAQETAPQTALKNSSKEAEGKGQYIWDFGEGGLHAAKHMFLQVVSASHEEWTSLCKNLVLFQL